METITEVQKIHTIKLTDAEARAVVADSREFQATLAKWIGAKNGTARAAKKIARGGMA